jgi:hypothetical protein
VSLLVDVAPAAAAAMLQQFLGSKGIGSDISAFPPLEGALKQRKKGSSQSGNQAR